MNDQRLRPVVGGISAGNYQSGATGTVGLPVYDARTGELLILSNAHVFESEGNIVQPGPADGGSFSDRVATVIRGVTLSPDVESKIDAALAKPLSGANIIDAIVDIGQVAGSVPAEVGMEVFKSGRTTQLTSGVVLDVDAALDIGYRDVGKVSLNDLIFFKGPEPVVKGGDSGSALVTYIDGLPYVVGLVFAGPASAPFNYGVACKIQNIAEELGIVVATGNSAAEAKPVSLTGSIIDIDTGIQIPNARVSVDGAMDYTDVTGQYLIGLNEPRMYLITIVAQGYYGGQIEAELVLGNNTISIAMHPKTGLPLQEFIPLIIGVAAGSITLAKVVGGE